MSNLVGLRPNPAGRCPAPAKGRSPLDSQLKFLGKCLYKICFVLFLFVGFSLSVFAKDANTLTATGKGEAYDLIESAGFGYEVPDNSREHKQNPVRHIKQVYDEDLKIYVFAFQIHAAIDDDRGIESVTDRQRVEIKTYDKSPASMTAKEGETLLMRWKMRLPLGFMVTNKFCHLHQLKGTDNKNRTADVKHPLITLTACEKKNGSKKFELRYFDRKSRKMTAVKSANLEEFLGNWVEITEKVIFGMNKPQNHNGSYSIKITRLKDNRELLSYSSDELDLWQTDSPLLRPKWGIYRSLGENRSLENMLRDEEIRFSDFSITKS